MNNAITLLLVVLLLYQTVFINTNDVLRCFISIVRISSFVSEPTSTAMVVCEATSRAVSMVALLGVHTNEVVNVLVNWTITPRDAQNLCMVLTVICVKLLVILSYGPRKLNFVMHQFVKLSSAWVLILCGVMSCLFLGAEIPTVEALLVWSCSVVNVAGSVDSGCSQRNCVISSSGLVLHACCESGVCKCMNLNRQSSEIMDCS